MFVLCPFFTVGPQKWPLNAQNRVPQPKPKQTFRLLAWQTAPGHLGLGDSGSPVSTARLCPGSRSAPSVSILSEAGVMRVLARLWPNELSARHAGLRSTVLMAGRRLWSDQIRGGLYLTKGGEEEVISQSSSSLQNVLADRHGRDTGHCHCQVNCLFDQGRGGGIKIIFWVIILTPHRLVISD